MKNFKIALIALLVSSLAYAGAGDGVKIQDTDINLNYNDGSMTVILDVGDSFTYRLLNNGAASTGLDVVVDLGEITAGTSGLTNGGACTGLVGLTALSALSDGVDNASCQAEVSGINRSILLQVPLRATLQKAGAGTVNVSYTLSNNNFQSFSLKNTRDLADFASATGAELLGTGAVAMSDGDDLAYDLELKAQLSGVGALSSYQAIVEIEVAP